MRWGLFRTWLVLSAFWVGWHVYLNDGPQTYAALWRLGSYEINYQDGTSLVVNLFKGGEIKSRTEISNELLAWLQKHRPDIDDADREAVSGGILNDLLDKHEIAVVSAKGAWWLTFAPPLALLGLGLCVFWIVRGLSSARRGGLIRASRRARRLKSDP